MCPAKRDRQWCTDAFCNTNDATACSCASQTDGANLHMHSPAEMMVTACCCADRKQQDQHQYIMHAAPSRNHQLQPITSKSCTCFFFYYLSVSSPLSVPYPICHCLCLCLYADTHTHTSLLNFLLWPICLQSPQPVPIEAAPSLYTAWFIKIEQTTYIM